MMRFAVSVILFLAAITKGSPQSFHVSPLHSVASEGQIRFAIESNYDDTGPGAKEPGYAYNTYKTLEEALIGYLDDPDTKLPEYDRNRAIQSLVKQNGEYRPENQELKRYYPKTVEEYTGFNRERQQEQGLEYTKITQPKTVQVYKGYRQPQPQSQLVLTKLRTSPPKKYYQTIQDGYFKQLQREKEVAEPYRLRVKHPFRGIPLRVGQYMKGAESHNRDDIQDAFAQFNAHPKYTYSYGVHVPDTGDSKSAAETREGGAVRGYYSFMDPDGRQRTVRYTANDGEGFKATVERAEQ